VEYLLIASFCAAFVVLAHRLGESGPERSRAAAWEAAAAACRIERVATAQRLRLRTLEGARGPLEIHLRSLSGTVSGHAGTRITVTGLAPRLVVRPAGEHEMSSEIAVGDPDFDRWTRVHGDAVEVQALLDAETRARLKELFATSYRHPETGYSPVSLGGGRLTLDCPDHPMASRVARLAGSIEEALAHAGRLVTPAAPEERLAASVAGDPIRTVRLQSLQVLLRDRLHHPETREALRMAMASEDDELRLLAALASGPDGVETLRALAASASSEDAMAARAVAGLGAELDVSHARRLLSDAVAADRLSTAVACVASLDRRGVVDLSLPETLLARGPGALVVPAVRALGLGGTAAAEPALIRALGHSDVAVRVAAIEALGRVGTAAAVPPLREAEKRLSSEGELVRAVNGAIASIQSRAVGADRGQLALAQPAGEVGLAEDARGRVSQDEP
jgi:HEAT repeat protein